MAQVSANTLTYDQIYLKLKNFMIKDVNNEFLTNTEKIEEYNKILKQIQDNILDQDYYYEPFIKGEPPTSSKLNKFSNNLSDNINSLAKQLDYLNAKTINGFNMFVREIENEKRYSERIASKAKILQMYSESPANDIIYNGDSFDNYDNIDIEKIKIDYNPLISNGKFTLPIKSLKQWSPSKVVITSTSGFMGNNHQVIRSTTPTNPNYEYIYEKYPGISLLNNVIDSNPLTYFEYEALNVDKSSITGDRSLVSENEFCYVANKKVNNGVTEGQLINWSNYNVDNGLTMSVVMESNNSRELTNYVEIVPYFGSSNVVKVNQIKVTDSNGVTENVLARPIFIGSSISAINLESFKDYFYNKATIRYAERKTLKIEIVFEQNKIESIQVQHLYWKPAYSPGSTIQSPFVGLNRFNPNLLNREIYEEVSYDQKALIPSVSNPNEFKKVSLPSIPRFKVTLRKKPITYNKWVITFKVDETTVYFFDFKENTNEVTGINYIINGPLPNNPNYNNGILKVGSKLTAGSNVALQLPGYTAEVGDRIVVRSQSDPQRNGIYIVTNLGSVSTPWILQRDVSIQWSDDLIFENPNLTPKYFNRVTDGREYLDAVTAFIQSLPDGELTYVKNFTTITSKLSNPRIATYTRQGSSTVESIDVPLSAQYEVFSARRLSIGLRDISSGYAVFANQAEVVSLPYYFDKPIDTLMLSVDRNINTQQISDVDIKYFVSLGDDVWRAISPIQLDNRGIAEVFALNQNIQENSKLPGIYYVNYPEIPEQVKEVRVKIEIIKKRNINITPEIYSYKLIAKVKQ